MSVIVSASANPFGPTYSHRSWSNGNSPSRHFLTQIDDNAAQAPSCAPPQVSIARGQSITINGLASCSDPQGNAMSTVSGTTSVGAGFGRAIANVTVAADGTITIAATANSGQNYDPNYYAGQTYYFAYKVQDTSGAVAIVPAQVVIN